jgi:hypothetical protein
MVSKGKFFSQAVIRETDRMAYLQCGDLFYAGQPTEK